jgi:DNA-binding response OmpR family regulator
MLAKGLREHAYAVDVAHDGEDAWRRLAVAPYDVVVLDVMLPRRSGLDVCRALRASGRHEPVLMLTARDGIDARIEGLDTGADDYLTKPFDFGELLARVRALVRRRALPVTPTDWTAGPLAINFATRTVAIRGVPVVLTAREFALLAYLAERHGEVVSRHDIARHVWDDTYDPLSNVIDVFVQRLRRKIDAPAEPSLIRARRGEGYQLFCPSEARG